MEEPVSFRSGPFTLRGMLHVPDPGLRVGKRVPGVLMCHGFTGHKAEAHFLFTKTARALCRQGLAVLRFDFRGSGDSRGEFLDVTISGEIEDARNALDQLEARPEVDEARVGVIGLSLGGCVAACLSGRRADIKATALWSAVAHPGQRIKALVLATPEREAELAAAGHIDLGGLAVSRAFVADALTLEPTVELAQADSAVLVVHGKKDQTVPFSDAGDYVKACTRANRSVELLAVERADHTYSSIPWESRVIEETSRFMIRVLDRGAERVDSAEV